MLAVKLHRKKRPWLGRGSHLVPILNWELGRVRVRKWMRLLESGWRGTNHTIRYLTLVRIPDEHPVALQLDWIDKYMGYFSELYRPTDEQGRIQFPALEDVPAEIKQELLEWADWGPDHLLPEIMLGRTLPRSRILWTRSRLKFYRGDGRR